MKLTIKLKRSMIGRPEVERDTLRALGLRRREQVVIRDDTPSIRGMIQRVQHLVEVTTQAE